MLDSCNYRPVSLIRRVPTRVGTSSTIRSTKCVQIGQYPFAANCFDSTNTCIAFSFRSIPNDWTRHGIQRLTFFCCVPRPPIGPFPMSTTTVPPEAIISHASMFVSQRVERPGAMLVPVSAPAQIGSSSPLITPIRGGRGKTVW